MAWTQIYRLPNNTTWHGESPNDQLAVLAEATLASGDATVDVPFKPGTTVYYLLLKKTTVTADSDVDVANDAIGDTATVGVLIISSATSLQGSDIYS